MGFQWYITGYDQFNLLASLGAKFLNPWARPHAVLECTLTSEYTLCSFCGVRYNLYMTLYANIWVLKDLDMNREGDHSNYRYSFGITISKSWCQIPPWIRDPFIKRSMWNILQWEIQIGYKRFLFVNTKTRNFEKRLKVLFIDGKKVNGVLYIQNHIVSEQT